LYKQKIDGDKTQIENYFFKMLDYHNEIVKNLNIKHINENKPKSEGRRAFAVFRVQLIRLLEVVKDIDKSLNLNLSKQERIDLAYLIFYYGIDERWENFLESKIRKNYSKDFVSALLKISKEIIDKENVNIGRTNQTSLSAYFRNMYNAIKLVNDTNLMSFKEKKRLIEIFRAQLSNPELYVLFLNIVSRFGKKWLEKKNNLILRYEFIKNLPLDYCGEYSPQEFFEMVYEEEELMN
jgi:hypothetical protein